MSFIKDRTTLQVKKQPKEELRHPHILFGLPVTLVKNVPLLILSNTYSRIYQQNR